MDLTNITKLENKIPPAVGKILVSNPFDMHYNRSVALLVEHDDRGSIAFLLNKPTELVFSDLLPELYSPDLRVFKGGEEQLDTLHMFHNKPVELGGNEVAKGVWWGGSYENLKEIIQDGNYTPEEIKVMVGFLGWKEGELATQISNGGWYVADLLPEYVFDLNDKDLYTKIMTKMGGNFRVVANIVPVNPQLN